MTDALHDFELLDRWGAGDRAAADELIGRHFDALYKFFVSKASEAVDDLVQDTLLACMSARERFARRSSFRTFLFGTARNILFEHYRKRRREPEALVGESRLIDLDPSPSTIMVHRAEQRVLLEALRRLPLDYQIAIELYQWEGLTGPELAEVLGISLTAVRSRLHRAKGELRRQIEEISASDEILRSTLAGLDQWAEALRESPKGPASE